MMKTDVERLIRRLKTQISVAERLDSQWVYITLNEAEECLELAEAEDVIFEYLSEIRKIQETGG